MHATLFCSRVLEVMDVALYCILCSIESSTFSACFYWLRWVIYTYTDTASHAGASWNRRWRYFRWTVLWQRSGSSHSSSSQTAQQTSYICIVSPTHAPLQIAAEIATRVAQVSSSNRQVGGVDEVQTTPSLCLSSVVLLLSWKLTANDCRVAVSWFPNWRAVRIDTFGLHNTFNVNN